MKRDMGGPAQSGVTLLDWFAATIRLEEISINMATIIMGEKPPQWGDGNDLECLKWWADAEARLRYLNADAMMKERTR